MIGTCEVLYPGAGDSPGNDTCIPVIATLGWVVKQALYVGTQCITRKT